MKEPVLANPLDSSEKKSIFENMYSEATEEDLLKKYIDCFVQKNGLKGYETRDISLRKLLASLVFGVVAALELLFIALYHIRPVFLLIVAELVVFIIFFRRQNLEKYLFRQVILRPDDNMDNILISQVSGARKGWLNYVLSLLPLVLAAAAALMIFRTPHMIFEKNDLGGYSLRYYTLALSPEENVVIPETWKGLPVNEIRGNVFRDMKSLVNVTLPSGLTQIRASTFERCKKLEAIDIPEGVTRIAAHAFCDCRSLERVTVPPTVNEIGSSAFRRCYALQSIEIPEEAIVNVKAFKESPTNVQRY